LGRYAENKKKYNGGSHNETEREDAEKSVNGVK